MCAFLSLPHQANPHLFERRNLCRADMFSTAGVRGSRPSTSTFRSSWKFPQQRPSKAFRTGLSQLSTPERFNSNFVARSSGIWEFEFLRAESLLTISDFRSTEISNFFSRILGEVTPIDVFSFTFLSTVFGIMAAYIFQELKDHVENPPTELLDHDRQGSPRIVNSSSVASETADVWLNLSRSPFFQSVCARCPSLSSSTTFEYVQNLKCKTPEFQRQCLPTPDGGTVALDWPSHLDIDGSKELENVMLLICGTTEGSHEDGIVKFSQLVEQHGYFPVVFNPRGCGGSPLTSPRVFSAADSDDVSLAVKFIANSRQWATIMGVGWGLGANCLTRYLGEEGSYTPLTAAVCIDNPFDLTSITRPISGSRWVDYNQSMSRGLVQILDSSKMLFQGEKRGFDVSRALTATSVRHFDDAISRVVHGYMTVEDFNVNNSSGAALEGVRIPLLYILHLEDYIRTQASIPNHVFETNAYTMLLVANPSDSRDDHPGAASDWTHGISLEWLTAVEISMLKGRHPQLSEFVKLPKERSNVQFSDESMETMNKVATAVSGTTSGNSHHKEAALKDGDMEMKSNPSQLQKEESIRKSSLSSKVSRGEGAKASEIVECFEEGQKAEHQPPADPPTEAEEEMKSNPSQLQKEESTEKSPSSSKASRGEGAKASEEGRKAEHQSLAEPLTEAAEAERGQVVQVAETVRDAEHQSPAEPQPPANPPQPPGEPLTEEEEAERIKVVQVAETVMNVLDVTMPGTLKDAQKQQVLKAIGRGETIVTALEEAVPEDVRGKMSTAVSEVVQAQNNLKMAGNQPSAPILPAGVTDSIQSKLLNWRDEKAAPKSDVASKSGNDSREDIGMSGKTAQNDATTTKDTPDGNDKSNKKEKPTVKDETDSDKSTVATKGEELSQDPKDLTQQVETENKSGGKNKGPGDALSTSSPNMEDQRHDQGDQGNNKQEQPQGSVDGGESGQGLSSAGEKKDTAKDMISQGDSGEIDGRSMTDKDAKMPKDAESKGEVTPSPSNNGLQTPQSDPPKASSATPGSQPPGDPSSSDVPDGKSPASGSQDRPSTDLPADVSNAPPTSSQSSQSDSPKPEVSTEAPKSQATQSDAQPSDTPPSPPPENPPPAPAPPTPQNPPPQSPPVPLPSVGEALTALTGFDDSTQMAVTNVFGVVENVLDQLEKDKPSAEANSSSTVSAENMLNGSIAGPTKRLEENANKPEDEDRNDRDNSDNQPKDEALVPSNQHNGATPGPTKRLEQNANNSEDEDRNDRDNIDNQSKDDALVPSNQHNGAITGPTKRLEQNANNSEDEDRNDRDNIDNQSKDEAPVPSNEHNESHLQSSAESREERNEFKSTRSPVGLKGIDPENRFSGMTAGSREVKSGLSQNWRGYINDAPGQQTEPGSHEQDNPPNPQSTLFESSSNHVHDGAAKDIVDDDSYTETANQKRLKAMAAEIEAECDDTVHSSPSDQVPPVQENDSTLVADTVMNALKLEVLRRLGSAGLEALGVDLEKEVFKVANAVSEVVTMGKSKLLGTSQELEGTEGLDLGGKLGVLNGNSIVTALGSVLGSNSLLTRLLPFGVLAGVVMAALGATYLIVADDQEEELIQRKKSDSQIKHDANSSSSRRVALASERDKLSEELDDALAGVEHGKSSNRNEDGKEEWNEGDGDGVNEGEEEWNGGDDDGVNEGEEEWNDADAVGVNDSASNGHSDREQKSTEQTTESKPPHQGKMMGAMAAAMGATAVVASSATSSSEGQSGNSERIEGSERKLVPEIAEKALSIVSPVIPKTEAGELDHERLVGVLTEVGQRGGPLTLIGKVALLWGGLRGAMSLTDRLLAFLRIKERPLLERLLGFGVMAVLLWTPVLVPLLPTLLQQWATKSPSSVADAAAGIGLYGAVFILVTIWGRRVRDYDRPLVSYGLQLFSWPKARLFAGGLSVGLGMVSGYYVINWVLGYSHFTWDAIVVTNPAFPGALASTILTSWKVLMLATQSLAKAVAVALVEEVLFRAWLQDEIAVDLGYHWAVILSALAFAVVHWSPAAVAGLWFFAVALSGARARTNGDLSLAIGIHAGIVTTFSVMNLGGLVSFIPDAPAWLIGAYAGNPWSGALGTGMVAALAVALYPRQQVRAPEED